MKILMSSTYVEKLMKVPPKEKLKELVRIVQHLGFEKLHITSGLTAKSVLEKELAKIKMHENDTFYLILASEREVLGFHLEEFILNNLVDLESCMLVLVTNKSLEPFSSSIRAIDMRGNDLLHVPFVSKSIDYSISDKVHNISMIYTGKSWNRGHYIRKFIYEKYHDDDRIDIFVSEKGDAFDQYLKSNIESRKLYRYNLIIENSYDPGCFTERIKDALFSQCIPIYWGYMLKQIDELEDLYGVDLSYIVEVSKLGLEETLSAYAEDYFFEHEEVIAQNRAAITKYLEANGWDGLASFETLRSQVPFCNLVFDMAIEALRPT